MLEFIDTVIWALYAVGAVWFGWRAGWYLVENFMEAGKRIGVGRVVTSVAFGLVAGALWPFVLVIGGLIAVVVGLIQGEIEFRRLMKRIEESE